MKKITLFLSIIFYFSLANADNGKVNGFVNTVANNVIKITSNSEYSISTKASKFRSLMDKDFNTSWMSRFALGRLYNSLDSKQKNLYLKEYQNYLLYSYLPNLLKYSNETFKITKTEQTGKRNVTVHTEILRKDGRPPIQISYVVRKNKNQPENMQIIDIVVEGISTIMSQRSEFKEITTNSGFDHLVKLLHNKNQKMAAQYS